MRWLSSVRYSKKLQKNTKIVKIQRTAMLNWDQTFGEAKVIVKTQKVVKICHDMIGW